MYIHLCIHCKYMYLHIALQGNYARVFRWQQRHKDNRRVFKFTITITSKDAYTAQKSERWETGNIQFETPNASSDIHWLSPRGSTTAWRRKTIQGTARVTINFTKPWNDVNILAQSNNPTPLQACTFESLLYDMTFLIERIITSITLFDHFKPIL